MNVTNRTSDVDLQNYLSNGEWELLDASLGWEKIIYSIGDTPFTHAIVSLKRDFLDTMVPSVLLIFQDKTEDPVLHVQHCVPLHDDVNPHGARILYASRFRLAY